MPKSFISLCYCDYLGLEHLQIHLYLKNICKPLIYEFLFVPPIFSLPLSNQELALHFMPFREGSSKAKRNNSRFYFTRSKPMGEFRRFVKKEKGNYKQSVLEEANRGFSQFRKRTSPGRRGLRGTSKDVGPWSLGTREAPRHQKAEVVPF